MRDLDKKIEELKPLVYSIELRDVYTQGHSERVANYAKDFGRFLRLSDEEVNDLYFAGLLHDLGKVGIPDSILLKPGKLEKEEFELIKYHSVLSGNIVEKIKNFSYLSKIIKYHHENFDGSGYPDGLKGEEIPFLSRILSLCDVFDALTTKRIYRNELSLEEALEVMEKEKHKFDPKLFEKFKNFIKNYGVIEENFFELNEEVISKLRNNIFFIDPLTKFLNRQGLLALLQRNTNVNLFINLIEININKFKAYNKAYGLKKGDELLKNLADEIRKFFKIETEIKEKIRDKDIFGVRLNADRFLLLSFGRRGDFLQYKIESFKDFFYKKYKVGIRNSFIAVDKLLTKKLINEIGYLI